MVWCHNDIFWWTCHHAWTHDKNTMSIGVLFPWQEVSPPGWRCPATTEIGVVEQLDRMLKWEVKIRRSEGGLKICTWCDASSRRRNWQVKGKHQKWWGRPARESWRLLEEVLSAGIKHNYLYRDGITMKEGTCTQLSRKPTLGGHQEEQMET